MDGDASPARSGARPLPKRSPAAKPHPRVYAFDDAPFAFEQERTPVVGLVVVLPSYVEGVLRDEVMVDGPDATEVLLRMVGSSSHRAATRAIMLGGITLGGFNMVDLTRLNEASGLPVLTVTRAAPDFDAMERALRKYLPDRPELLRLLRAHPLFTVPMRPRPLWVAVVGMPKEEATRLVLRSIVRGSYPEPLRLAHLFASAIPKGPVSRSRA
ncbi:MAG: DUF99 family protein [Euryarchaeota archaeon]|nr:DUF99 family protein [Euryarchaeota archaeon]MDE1835743.1 DUF99 family protein [Euryarchaeota archaeon]MDE1880832.1 DUF99 family protein [Euryarchaeota archaeon]MDE2043934.1 DUF99 family protein [Thermoplasmata archaeon]